MDDLYGRDLFGEPIRPSVELGPLAREFGWPPFTVFDARSGAWQERKRAWLSLGIQSELGRGDKLLGDGAHSVFTGDSDWAGKRGGGGARRLYSLSSSAEEDQERTEDWGKRHGVEKPVIRLGSVDFYTRKRALEQETGRTLSTPEAAEMMLAPRPVLDSGAGRVNLNSTNTFPTGTSTMDFYAQKRKLEAELGRELTYQEAEAIVLERGSGSNARAANRHMAFHGGRYLPWAPGAQELLNRANGTSIFDPVLCELLLRWFCPAGGLVLDPFAGGSVRGIVASLLGRRYVGVDLSERQLQANRDQAAVLTPDAPPQWHCGDSQAVLPTLDVEADFVFSCPPYGDLEQYTDDPRDLSTMTYERFLVGYRAIIAAAVARLRPGRFASFVVGEFRDTRTGRYRGFVKDTIDAFEAAGAMFYNDAILLTAVGSLPVRVGSQFRAGRKLGKTHQNVLVFVKGDWKEAAAACRAAGQGAAGADTDDEGEVAAETSDEPAEERVWPAAMYAPEAPEVPALGDVAEAPALVPDEAPPVAPPPEARGQLRLF